MKKSIRVLSTLLLVILIISCIGLVACNDDKSPYDPANDISNYQEDQVDQFGQQIYNKNLFYSNTVIQGGPDPDIFDDRERTGYYYLYVTEAIWRSTNLTDWEEIGDIFAPQNEEEKNVLYDNRWAPEVVWDDETNQYIMFFSSTAKYDSNVVAGQGVTLGNGYCILHAATSDSPEGPFTIVNFKDTYKLNKVGGLELTQEEVDDNLYAWVKEGDTYYQAAFTQYFAEYALLNPEEMYKMLQPYGNLTNGTRNGLFPRDTIDPHPFVDPETGEKYLHCTVGTSKAMMIVKMKDWLTPDWSSAALTIVQKYYTVEDAVNGENFGVEYETTPVNEGPHMLYHKDKNGKGLYYLTYSINGYGESTYQVGIAVAENIMGPYRKLQLSEGALLLCSSTTNSNTISGTGHHSFISIGGQDFVIYHRHNDYNVGGDLRYTAIDEYKWITITDIYGNDMDIPYANGPTDSIQPLPEEYSEYRNVADEAKVSADKDIDLEPLTDGLLTIHKSSADSTFRSYFQETLITKKTTISFKYDTPLTARAILVYNSVEEEYVFTNIDRIELVGEDGNVKTIHNVKFDTDRYCEYGGMDNDIMYYCYSGTAAVVEFYDTKVKEVRIVMSVPEGMDAIAISEIRILGKDGEPTYVGEGEYTFTNPEAIKAEVDEGMTLDGYFDEKKWSQVRWLSVQDKQAETQYADIDFTMWYGEKGVFFGMIVKETGATIWHNPGRASYLNSCIEMYMGPADAEKGSNTIFEFDFGCDSSIAPKLYSNLMDSFSRFVQENEIMPMSVAIPLGGDINTEDCYGYQIEAFFPYGYLEAAGYDVSDIDNLILAINPVHIWSFNYDGVDVNKDRYWSDWAQQYITASWVTPSSWFKFGKDGLLAYDYNVEVEGPVKVKVTGMTSNLGLIIHGANASFTLKVVNGGKEFIKSITVNGKEIDLDEVSWSGGSGTFTVTNVKNDLNIVITTEK